MVDNEQEAIDFLERLDIKAQDVESKTKFANKLDSIFEKRGLIFATRKQIEALFPVAESKLLGFAEVGIKRIEFLRLGKPQTRFAIPHKQGLFNLASAQIGRAHV